MGDCCARPRGWDKIFGEKTARRDLNRYRKKGLDDTSAELVRFLRERGLAGLTVLEIGGGVGALGVELLRAGAERAVNAELSPHYEPAARELWREAGVEGRTEYRVGDVTANGLEPADAVVMNKVVCCYPDAEALVSAAADRARRYLVMSFPRERRLNRIGLRALNLWARLLRWEFRSYIHPVAGFLAEAERRGLRVVGERQGLVWQVAALERA